MVAKEAIEEMKSYVEHSWGGLNEAFEAAISALEKQVPKKVVSYSDDESDHVYCPCCHECIGSNEIVWEDFYYRGWSPMHCQECGQAMIWK